MTNTNINNEKQNLYNDIVEEVREKVQKLKEFGMSEKEITSLFRTEQPLLKLFISKNYKIFLGDERKEVRMEPLVKAVYLLFLTNPLLNSINEKCARIRGAFLGQFDDRMAKHYYITGGRGEAKRITLPRDLVVWE